MSVIITGGAGFIGVNLTERLLLQGFSVIVLDNFSNSSISNIEKFLDNPNFNFKVVDLASYDNYFEAVSEYESNFSSIWHLAANSDIQSGIANADIDLQDTFLTTYNTLKIIKHFSIKNLFFASSSAIYGDHGSELIHEDLGPLLPISNYGAMKLASEAIISSAAESFLNLACIYRFPNVIGVPATHGVLHDLIAKLLRNPSKLDVLGNGAQAKSYLHVSDLIDAMMFINSSVNKKLNIYNIASCDPSISVSSIAEEIVRKISPSAQVIYGDDPRGWVGDVPRVNYSSEKLRNLGWAPKFSSSAAVSLSIDQIIHELTSL